MARVLVAPQEFKGSARAVEAAKAIATGIVHGAPGSMVDQCPLSDGGPGLLDVLYAARGGEFVSAPVSDPLGRTIEARYLVLGDGTAVIEAAQANGLALLRPEERDPLRADSHGVGELIAHALRRRPRRLVIGVGGSATNDGGAGMARALGAALWDVTGQPLLRGAAALVDLARLDWDPPAELAEVDVVVAVDVRNPLLGADGATAVYGPQKGAKPADIDLLEAALTRWAAVVRRARGVDIATLPGGGAAGGLAAGLVAMLGARIVSGFELVAEVVGLQARMESADFVATGEGQFDEQSWQGKVVGEVVHRGQALGKATVIFAGNVGLGARIPESVELIDLARFQADETARMAEVCELLSRAAADWAARALGTRT